ncbi:MAG: toxin-antitoxin system YwqK family antitoxin [Spirochaetia bacterium]|nr:toxin-antitoxin system YwqK family antitoxin [Spirochaetia bacterium]
MHDRPAAGLPLAALAALLLVTILTLCSLTLGCDRLFRVPSPDGVPSDAARNRKTGLWEWTDADGKYHMAYGDGRRAMLGTVAGGLRQGEWRSFGPDGEHITSIGAYKDDFRTGIWHFYDDQGVLYMTVSYKPEPMSMEIAFLSHDYGNENGITERFFPDGRLEERSVYSGGFPDGEVVRYYRNGRKAAEGRYAHGLRTGSWRFYYQDGGVERTESYVAGKLDGSARNYHPGGALYHESIYKDGVQVDVRIANAF